ncbi:MAG: hypothetical protein ABL977_02335 [Candidatus Eisenbacteria bacterium]
MLTHPTLGTTPGARRDRGHGPRFAGLAGIVALSAVLGAGACSSARAASEPGFTPMVTDSFAVFGIPALPEPGYLEPLHDPVFGTWVLRIGGDPGAPLSPLGARWSDVSRHVYSKQQPWNANHSLLCIRNTGSAVSPVILQGSTYVPVRGPCSNYDRWDYRWHPSLFHANEQINVNRAGTELLWFDVMNCVKTRSWALPIVADYGIGSGEGNVSADGRFVAIANQHQMVVVDMDPKTGVAPAWPYRRIGPVYTFAACSLDVSRPELGAIDNVSISPSGKYIDVKYAGLALAGAASCDTLYDLHRVFEVDSGLVIRSHRMDASALRCGSFAARTEGWTFPLKHADLAADPFDGNEDVLIGGRACPGSQLGHVVKVRLRDGKVTSLTDPRNEAPYSHGSARNTRRPGWFYVTCTRDPFYQGSRFWGETVALKIDGSGEVQRFAHYHSTQSTYDAEAQAVPSPDGRRVLFASDWRDHCTTCGKLNSAKAYVVDAREVPLAGLGDSPAAERAAFQIARGAGRGLVARFTLGVRTAARLEVHDVAGRLLLRRELGGLAPGPHELTLDPTGAWPSGVYFATLRSGDERLQARGALVR